MIRISSSKKELLVLLVVWRWLLDTRAPPVIISPSSGPDKDLDITDGVETETVLSLSCHLHPENTTPQGVFVFLSSPGDVLLDIKI